MNDWTVAVLLDPRLPRGSCRFALSRGVRAVNGDERYEPRAPVPLNFETLGELPSPALRDDSMPAHTRTVGVLPFSEALLHELRLAAASAKREALQETLPAIASEIARAWTVARPPRAVGFGQNAPGMATVTRDPRSGLLVGLHVDTLEAYNADRSSAGNRISINIGKSPRHFLFVPYDFRSLARAGTRSAAASVVRRFFESCAEVPVVGIRIEPGEGYVAPTECIIHDASTIGSRDPDLHITALGRFEPPLG